MWVEVEIALCIFSVDDDAEDDGGSDIGVDEPGISRNMAEGMMISSAVMRDVYKVIVVVSLTAAITTVVIVIAPFSFFPYFLIGTICGKNPW